MRLARGSTIWVSVPILAFALLAAMGSWYVSALAMAGSLVMIFFHRDPDRTPKGTGMISPADGILVEAGPQKIAIFMNHLDVHVNRAPLDGTVKRVDYCGGSHLPAFLSGASRNEKNVIEIETPGGTVELCQIAGAMARKIVCYVKPGDSVVCAQRIGMIRFGSRVEATIPRGYRVCVERGQRVRAGETVIAVKEI